MRRVFALALRLTAVSAYLLKVTSVISDKQLLRCHENEANSP